MFVLFEIFQCHKYILCTPVIWKSITIGTDIMTKRLVVFFFYNFRSYSYVCYIICKMSEKFIFCLNLLKTNKVSIEKQNCTSLENIFKVFHIKQNGNPIYILYFNHKVKSSTTSDSISKNSRSFSEKMFIFAVASEIERKYWKYKHSYFWGKKEYLKVTYLFV